MNQKMKEIREELNDTIRQYGVNSKEALSVSKELDLLIIEYYKDNEIYSLKV